ncbi:MAG: 16S rRNA (cytidine(1402)-2'-O)-methyltransferase [Rhodobacterales bacterium]|jgi:16S rRNA (cytidine1402-2'-O)-methyltransferase|tara:strand:+ start:68 stop:940 length:873 start_codon:yes stop_codon:yes gene_type:complete
MIGHDIINLDPGLYFVATPIGAARDITLRAMDVLRDADVLVAEDTRSLRKLMDIHSIPLRGRKIISYNDHNGSSKRPLILSEIALGKSVSYSSEAGSPLVADPGYQLGREVTNSGYRVVTVPGACAVIAALTVSGLPTNQFFYAGFLPNSKSARQKFLKLVENIPGTLVFYESPKRLNKALIDMLFILGPERPVVIARELTKKFEETIRSTLGEINEKIEGRSIKGEIVILLGKKPETVFNLEDLNKILLVELRKNSLKDSVLKIAMRTGVARSLVYKAALEIINTSKIS